MFTVVGIIFGVIGVVLAEVGTLFQAKEFIPPIRVLTLVLLFCIPCSFYELQVEQECRRAEKRSRLYTVQRDDFHQEVAPLGN